MNNPKCKVCKKTPEEISEYNYLAKEENITPTKWVMENERFIPGTNKFYCTKCYVKVGMPLF